MEEKKILFITFDMSGYYDSVFNELSNRYKVVDYYNTAKISYRYKNVFEKLHSLYYKIFKGLKLKNYLKCETVIQQVKESKYDIVLIVRPDLFFNDQLEILKNNSSRMIAYYHDSINNIPRKQDVIHFFDAVYSYEKRDVEQFKLKFLPNFIYLNENLKNEEEEFVGFTVMSKDYRFNTLKKVASNFKKNNLDYSFCVFTEKSETDDLITFINERMSNEKVLSNLKKSRVIVDIHKYGIQDGLTFRVFESLGLKKKLITTNKNIINYDFYNPNNIFVIEDINNINIPLSFLESRYQDISEEIIKKYKVDQWVTTILN